MTNRRNFLSVMGGYLGLGVTGSVNAPIGREGGMLPDDEAPPQFSREMGEEEITVSFKWSFREVKAELEKTFSRQRYDKLASESVSRKNQFQRVVNSELMDTLQNEIYEVFDEGRKEFNDTTLFEWPKESFPRYSVMLSFVQSIPYRTDLETVNRPDYVRHPIEILVDGVGDCTGRSVFLAGLLSAVGHDTGYAILPGHMAPLVSHEKLEYVLNGEYKVWHQTDLTDYTVIETTTQADVGTVVDEYKPKDVFYVYTVENGFEVMNPDMLTESIGEATEKTIRSLI